MAKSLRYAVSPPLSSQAVTQLKSAAWPVPDEQDYSQVMEHSLAYVCAFDGEDLVGFVNVAWDGGVHAFLLDTTVHPEFQRNGIGVELVRLAAEAARVRGCEWLHVDFEPGLAPFYERCGFVSTSAGLLRLRPEEGR